MRIFKFPILYVELARR